MMIEYLYCEVSIDGEHISSVDELQNELLKISETYVNTMISKAGIYDSSFAKVIKKSITETVNIAAYNENKYIAGHFTILSGSVSFIKKIFIKTNNVTDKMKSHAKLKLKITA